MRIARIRGIVAGGAVLGEDGSDGLRELVGGALLGGDGRQGEDHRGGIPSVHTGYYDISFGGS